MTNTEQKTPEAQADTNIVKFIAKKRGFDLEKMERVSIEVPGEFHKAKSMQEVLERISSDDAKLVDIYNAWALRDAKYQAKRNAGGGLVNTKIVNTFVNAFRMLPPYSLEKERTVQTEMIFGFIKGQPALLESLKQAAAQVEDDDDEDGDDEATA